MASTIRRTLLGCLQVYKQWGLAASDVANRSITYPITVTTPLAFMATLVRHDANQNWWGLQATGSVDASTLKPCVYKSYAKIWNEHNTAVFWMLIAKQQWGYEPAGFVDKEVTYPIAFKLSNIVLVSLCSRINTYAVAGYDVTLTKFSIYALQNFGRNVSWFAVGVQQWGKCNAGTQFSFPIPYKIKCYAITFGVHYDSSQYGYNQVVSYNTLGFTMYQALGTGNIASMWISLGR